MSIYLLCILLRETFLAYLSCLLENVNDDLLRWVFVHAGVYIKF